MGEVQPGTHAEPPGAQAAAMSGYLPPTEHARLEHAAVAALRRLGYEVKRTADGVEVAGPGFTLRARCARDLVADAGLTRPG